MGLFVMNLRYSSIFCYVFVSLISFFFLSGSAYAQALREAKNQVDELSNEESTESLIPAMELSLKKARPSIKIDTVTSSPIPNIFVVKIKDGPSVYSNSDGTLVFTGDMLVLKDGVYARWEDPSIAKNRATMYGKLDAKDAIVFPAKGETKAVVYVFTDVECGYCIKLHSQLSSYTENGVQYPGYNDLGIEVRYLAFPRTGLDTESGTKAVSAWCAKDRRDAINKLKNGESIPTTKCINPVAKQFEIGSKIGVNGTPAIWLPNGDLKPGYMPPTELANMLGIGLE